MTRRIKKPSVRPELAREWLKRNEEDGESPPQIAAKDGYDVRTVRKQIEIARQEREVREARGLVLRAALERHYDDLQDVAEKLNSQLLELGNIPWSPDDDLKQFALRQHLPRSPIWNYKTKLDDLRQKKSEQLEIIISTVKQRAETDRRLTHLTKAGADKLIPNILVLLTSQLDQWSNGGRGIEVNNFVVESLGEGKVNPRLGGFHMGPMAEELFKNHRDLLKEAIEDLQKVKGSEEYHDLEETIRETNRIQEKLHEELAVIRLRRIVPGRCKFCPI